MHLALQRSHPTRSITSILGTPASRRGGVDRQSEASDLIELLGLDEFRHRYVSDLATGTRRLAELGCVAALGADVLLLDEPTAGFAHREVERFVDVVRRLRMHLDATIVVIDHDVPMMMELTDRLYVLEAGIVIAEGPPSLLFENQRVATAYMGEGRAHVQPATSIDVATAP